MCTCSLNLGNNYRENGSDISLRSIGRGGADVVKHGVRGELECRGYHVPGIDGHRGEVERWNLIIRLWTGHTVYGIWPSVNKKEMRCCNSFTTIIILYVFIHKVDNKID